MICENCGTTIPEGNTSCAFCGQAVSAANQTQATAQAQTTAIVTPPVENVVTGIVGAILGATLGAASIILLSQLGYVAALSGLILAVCTLKGYELLGKTLSKKGLIICIILILVTPYIADRFDWAILIQKSLSEYTLGEAFMMVPEYIEVGAIEMSDYLLNLVMVYGFAALGAFSTIKDVIRK